MSGIPDHEIVRDYGMHMIHRPLTGYELRGWWNGELFLAADLLPEWRDAKAVFWNAVDVLRQTTPPDVNVHLRMLAVTGRYPSPSFQVMQVTL